MENTFTLSDHAIIRIVDLLQLAMLTGTDCGKRNCVKI